MAWTATWAVMVPMAELVEMAEMASTVKMVVTAWTATWAVMVPLASLAATVETALMVNEALEDAWDLLVKTAETAVTVKLETVSKCASRLSQLTKTTTSI